MPTKNSSNSTSRRSASTSGGGYSRGYGSVSTVPTRNTMATPASTPAAAVQQQRPSLFKEMAATAGGVAVGSAIGHAVGHALTGGVGSTTEQSQAPQQQAAQDQMTEPTGPCAWEIKQFLQCAQSQTNLTLCEGFNEAIKQCKITHGIK